MVWYLIVSIPDLCTLTYFKVTSQKKRSLYMIYLSMLCPIKTSTIKRLHITIGNNSNDCNKGKKLKLIP